MKNSKRIEYVDLFRGIGIILMIMGHVGFGSGFSHWVGGFHMPLFFFVSGYFFKEGITFKFFLKKKVKTLLFPYMLFCALYYSIWLLFIRNYSYYVPLKSIFLYTTDGNIPINNALWFLVSLFIVEIGFVLLRKFLKNDTHLVICVAVIVVLGHMFARSSSIKLPWGLDASMVGMGFFLLAYMLKKYNMRCIRSTSLYRCLLTFILGMIIIWLNPQTVSMWGGRYGNEVLFWGGALLSLVSLWNICRILSQHTMITKVPMYRLLTQIGSTSMLYVCLNQFVIVLVRTRIVRLMGDGIIPRLIILLLVICAIWCANCIVHNEKIEAFLKKYKYINFGSC